MSSYADDPYPRKVGHVNLETEATRLGIRYFLACGSSFTRDMWMVMIPVNQAQEFQKYGYGFPGLADFHVGMEAPKLQAVPVINTLVQLPWEPKLAFIACELYEDGKPFYQCPRHILKKVLRAAEERNISMKTGVEFEFFLFKKDKHEELIERDSEMNMYNRAHMMEYSGFIKQIMNLLESLDWEPDKFEKEGQPSQFELNMKYTDALDMADRHLACKFLLKSLAEHEGYRAVFMPMPVSGMTGNGMHLNFSLWDAKSDENITGDHARAMRLSQLSEHALAGIMGNLKGLTAISCPHVNSYKRLHAFANHMRLICYGESKWSPVRCLGERLEYRLPDGAVNPYLTPASVLAACLDGIHSEKALNPKELFDKKLELETMAIPITGYEILPDTIEKACDELELCESLKRYMGEKAISDFIHLRKNASMPYKKQISDWELCQAVDY